MALKTSPVSLLRNVPVETEAQRNLKRCHIGFRFLKLDLMVLCFQ